MYNLSPYYPQQNIQLSVIGNCTLYHYYSKFCAIVNLYFILHKKILSFVKLCAFLYSCDNFSFPERFLYVNQALVAAATEPQGQIPLRFEKRTIYQNVTLPEQ